MKTIIKALVSLYPRSWRNRYENEFDALLSDVSPTWHTLFDVLGGAIKMQWKTGGWWKIVAAYAALGVLASMAYSWSIPSRYASTAVLQSNDSRAVNSAVVYATARAILTHIIVDESLYVDLRRTEPLEDVIERMRRNDILLQKTGPASYSLSFLSTDPEQARRVAATLATRFVEAGGVELATPASLPVNPIDPRRSRAFWMGLIGGVLIGAVVAMFNGLKVWKAAVGMGLAGAAVGAAVWFAIPAVYSSTAVIEVRPAGAAQMPRLIRAVTAGENLDKVVHTFGLYPKDPHAISKLRENLRIVPIIDGAAFTVTFRYQNRYMAQKVTQDVAGTILDEAVREAFDRPAQTLELLDPASLPLNPAYPNLPAIAIAGLLVGLFCAILLGIRRRWRGQHPVVA